MTGLVAEASRFRVRGQDRVAVKALPPTRTVRSGDSGGEAASYYNTKVQVGELEALVRRLADASGPEL